MRPVVAHVNYLFFLSTQSFIYFYLAHPLRFRPICLTRAPESPSIRSEPPPALAGSLFVYGDGYGSAGLPRSLSTWGLTLRRALTRLPPAVAQPTLNALHRWVVPHLRADADVAHYLDWVETILRREEARILHAYFGPVGWSMIEVKRRLGLPLVVSFLGDDVGPEVSPWWWWLIRTSSAPPDWPARLRELFAEADLLLVEGPFLRQRLIDMGCPAQKLVVQRVALPLDELAPAAREPRRDGKLVILFAGRFCARKGVLYALEAMARLRARRQDVELRLIGDDTLTEGGYASEVYAAIRRLGLESCTRLLGFVDHETYVRELAAADVFLHPSIVDDEGFSEGGAPTTILEAQALGVPVVATLHCDIPNVTAPGESALLVPERDSAALADALAELLDDAERRREMGRAGRRFVQQHHDIVREAALLEERYASLLGGGGPSPR